MPIMTGYRQQARAAIIAQAIDEQIRSWPDDKDKAHIRVALGDNLGDKHRLSKTYQSKINMLSIKYGG